MLKPRSQLPKAGAGSTQDQGTHISPPLSNLLIPHFQFPLKTKAVACSLFLP